MRLPAQTQLLLNPGLEAPYVAVASSHIATNWTDDAYFGELALFAGNDKCAQRAKLPKSCRQRLDHDQQRLVLSAFHI